MAVGALLAVFALAMETPASPMRRWWLSRVPDAALRWEAALHPREPWPLYHLGMRLARRGNLRSGLEALEECARRAPHEVEPLLGVAEVQMNAGAPGAALAALERALALDPRHALAHRVLGEISLDLGDTNRAVVEIEAATRLDPSDAEAWYLIGRVSSLEQGEAPRARSALQRAVRLAPDHAPARRELARVLMRDGSFGEAEQLLRVALRLDPSDVVSHAELGAVLRRHRPDPARLAEAQRELQQAVRREPAFAPAQYELGLLFADEQQWADARPPLEAAARLAPENQGAWHHLARVRERLGDAAGARAARDRFRLLAETQAEVAYTRSQVDRQPGDVALRLKLVRLHRRRGEWRQAVEHLREVRRRQPRQPEALRAVRELERAGHIRRVPVSPP